MTMLAASTIAKEKLLTNDSAIQKRGRDAGSVEPVRQFALGASA